ncbi:hypothetical protein ABIE63_000048 [Limibacillus sp. MBR-115]|jgi:hypothetical protein
MASPLKLVLLIFLLVSLPGSFIGRGQTPASTGEADLELVLAVDCSSSVDALEYQLQMEGLSQAFSHPSVLKAIEAHAARGIVVTLVQWAGADAQRQVIDWQRLRSRKDALALSRLLAATPRQISGPTAVGDVIDFSARLLLTNAWAGKRQVIDVSGDGRHNEGEAPPFARARATKNGIVINGLAILNEEKNLDRYYAVGVVGGPGSFLEIANDYEAFAIAIRRKLQQEISGVPIS